MADPKLSSQDVRSRVLALRDELIENLEMIREAIRQDREHMTAYFRQFRDFRYRPITSRDNQGNPTAYGSPTEVTLEPLATQMRTTVKSLLDSIRVIETEILPEDDPEGKEAGRSGEEGLKARLALRESFRSESGAESLPAPVDAGPVARTPKEKAPAKEMIPAPLPAWMGPEEARKETSAIEKKSPAVKTEERRPPPPEDLVGARQEKLHVEAKPRPWRETTPKRSETTPRDPELPESGKTEAKDIPPDIHVAPKPAPGPIGLSPALRAQLSGSRMDVMRDKYAKKKDEE